MGRSKTLKRARRVYRAQFDRLMRDVGKWPLRERLRIAWWIVRGRPRIVFRKTKQ